MYAINMRMFQSGCFFCPHGAYFAKHSPTMKSPRRLLDPADKYLHNCWDDAAPSHEEFESIVLKVYEDHKYSVEYNVGPSPWDVFYRMHAAKFYKDRSWIIKEIPWLFVPGMRIAEIGCGVGNALALFNEDCNITGYDFSQKAVELAKVRFPSFCFKMHNLVTDRIDACDAAMMIFTLSAIDPQDHIRVLQNIHSALSPGGRLVFRDFGRYDYRQAKYRPEQAVGRNFYRRGDGTFAYFFCEEEFREIAENVGFCVVELETCRSLTVNRKTRFEMYRVTIKGVLQK